MGARRKIAAARKKKMITEEDAYLRYVKGYLEQFAYGDFYLPMMSYLENKIKTKGKRAVAKAIKEMWDKGIIPEHEVFYKKAPYENYMSKLMARLGEREDEIQGMIDESYWDEEYEEAW